MTGEDDFATGRMLPLLLRMAAPAIAAQTVNMLYGLVDRIFIGHIEGIGATALAGVGICNTIIVIVAAFAQFVGGGGAPLTAIELGRGNREEARRLFGNGVSLLLVFALVAMAVTYLAMDPLLRLVGASDATLPYARDYLSVYLLGTPLVMVTIGLNPFINVEGKPIVAMLSVLIGAGLNMVLDPILIFVAGLGVRGAALASVISQGASAAWILHFFLRGERTLRLGRGCLERGGLGLDGHSVRKILSLGISPFAMSSTEGIIGLVMNSGLATYGDLYVSTLTVMQSTMMICSVPLSGFETGVTPVISYNYGRRDWGRVREAFRIVFTVSSLANFLLNLLMILFPGVFARLFTTDADLVASVSRTLPMFLTGMLLFGMQRACQTMFVALNQPRVSLFVALLRKIFLLVPLALILPRFVGVMGIYLAEPIADATAATVCMTIFAKNFRGLLWAGSDRAR